MDQKVRENRLRRMARRQGLSLRKCRSRDRRAIGYGKYAIVNAHRVSVGVRDSAFELTIDDVESWLTA